MDRIENFTFKQTLTDVNSPVTATRTKKTPSHLCVHRHEWKYGKLHVSKQLGSGEGSVAMATALNARIDVLPPKEIFSVSLS